jgi:hypothetical protein
MHTVHTQCTQLIHTVHTLSTNTHGAHIAAHAPGKFVISISRAAQDPGPRKGVAPVGDPLPPGENAAAIAASVDAAGLPVAGEGPGASPAAGENASAPEGRAGAVRSTNGAAASSTLAKSDAEGVGAGGAGAGGGGGVGGLGGLGSGALTISNTNSSCSRGVQERRPLHHTSVSLVNSPSAGGRDQ